jgi:EpsI family protein
MSSVATRLFLVVGIVLAVYGGSYLVQVATEPPELEMPEWSIQDLPLKLGEWHGEDTEMDPKIAVATGAAVIVNRLYRDEMGRVVSLHSAMFEDPAEGIYHSPLNCYRSSGWKKLSETREDVKVAEDLAIPVSVTTWEKDNEKIVVAYWFQLGQHVLYDRFDLGKVRWGMKGQETWPVLFKVMVQIPLTDLEDSKTIGLDFSQKLAEWLNQPEHRKYLDRWGGI